MFASDTIGVARWPRKRLLPTIERHSPFNFITSRQSATLAFKDVPFFVPVFRIGSTNLIVVNAPHCGHTALLAVDDGIVGVNAFRSFRILLSLRAPRDKSLAQRRHYRVKNSLRYAFTNVGSPSGVIRPRRCLIECRLGDGIMRHADQVLWSSTSRLPRPRHHPAAVGTCPRGRSDRMTSGMAFAVPDVRFRGG